MTFLRGRTLPELQKRVDHLLAVVEDRQQSLPASVRVRSRNRIISPTSSVEIALVVRHLSSFFYFIDQQLQ